MPLTVFLEQTEDNRVIAWIARRRFDEVLDVDRDWSRQLSGEFDAFWHDHPFGPTGIGAQWVTVVRYWAPLTSRQSGSSEAS